MTYKIFTLYDTASESYQMPVFSRNDNSAIRELVTSINFNKDSLVYFNPDDFLLYCVGDFDNESGQITSSLPRLVGRVGEFLKRGVSDEE